VCQKFLQPLFWTVLEGLKGSVPFVVDAVLLITAPFITQSPSLMQARLMGFIFEFRTEAILRKGIRLLGDVKLRLNVPIVRHSREARNSS
jgi:hypothetical protein